MPEMAARPLHLCLPLQKIPREARLLQEAPPYSKLPGDPAMERWLMNQFGLYYVGSLLTLVGYDPNFTVDDRRFWIRNIKG